MVEKYNFKITKTKISKIKMLNSNKVWENVKKKSSYYVTVSADFISEFIKVIKWIACISQISQSPKVLKNVQQIYKTTP